MSSSRLNFLVLVALPKDLLNILDEPTIIQYLCHTIKQLKELQCNHKELHQTYLESLAEAIVVQTSPGLQCNSMVAIREEHIHNQIKLLIHRKHTHRILRKIGHLLKPHTSLEFSKVDTPDPSASKPTFGDPSRPKFWTGS